MYNYHTHTFRCKHAEGTEDDMLRKAVSEGYNGLGFSDHVILPGITGRVRADWSGQEEYLSSIRRAQSEYAGQIEVYLGFECEWCSRFEPYYRDLLESKKVDYLIFGNHSIYFRNGTEHSVRIRSRSEFCERYRRFALAGLNSGLFSIMAHPDLYMANSPWSPAAERAAIDICKTAKERDIPLEWNIGCMRTSGGERELFGEHRHRYPYRKFWEIARDVGNTVVIGMDAHSPWELNLFTRKIADEMTRELGLTITDRVDTIRKRV